MVTWGGDTIAISEAELDLAGQRIRIFNRPATFTGLTPGQEYDVTVTCNNGFSSTVNMLTKRTSKSLMIRLL